jgi:hypothetical protein
MAAYTPFVEHQQSYAKTVDVKAYWPIMARLQHKLYGLYGPAIWQVGDPANLPEATAEMLEFVLGNFDVNAISADLLWQRMPYIAPPMYQHMLAGLIRAELLVLKADGRYQFTDQARQIGWRIFKAKHQRLSQPQLLLAEQEEELAYMLHRLVHASQVAAQPTHKRWLLSRCSYLAVNAPPMARIVEHLGDLNAFRDDCHLAAWQQHSIDAHTWEAFTLLWRRGDLSFSDVVEQLHKRGYRSNDYQAALHTLTERGWVTHQTGIYRLTKSGQQLRNSVEKLTDQTYYKPWACLHGHEWAQLYKLLTGLETAV